MVEAAKILERVSPLADQKTVSFGLLPPMTRLSARGGAEAALRFSRAFGTSLSADALKATQAGDRAALWLGPDEWLLIAPLDDRLAGSIEGGLAGEPGCIVDISHRQVGIEVSGTAAAEVLNAGCPLDLDLAAFPVGMCTRTVLAKADVVLWRLAPDHFRLECWRSFAPYCFDFLKQAADDCGY
ncbi:sarcosine oxidase subunit gamma [Lichenihabitans sp. PAMC28606]|uniref:sarcosine oxidase subunit gamma n=1 Tax=Lichenihabitans sp. PAMC28606 TaxID=2880932 RepID=UPI001D0B8A93|nr:sarcosine oxidase subunit gamma family protein [Lichenihabitans sp. PAMC28606]UDL94542.1 sarcosine oxidase subunit gamma [Lichenihabitans sp. PAMC28606]